MPLAVGSNVITIKVIPSDSTPTLTYTVTIFREGVDRATLTALYNSAGGASWTDKTNWGSPTEPLNTWFGVKVDGNGNVTELALPDNNLSGPLPAELGSLTSLTTLDLSDNQLSGTIPDLSSLTQLQNLNLGDNQLSGTIPDWLSSLTQLTDPESPRQPVDGGDPGGAGRPQPAGSPVPGRQPVERDDSGCARRASADCSHTLCGQHLDGMRAQRVALSRDRLGL